MAFASLSQGRGWFNTLNEDLKALHGKSSSVSLIGINGWTSNGCFINQYETDLYKLIILTGQMHYDGQTVNNNYNQYIAKATSDNVDLLTWQHGVAVTGGKVGDIYNEGNGQFKLIVPNFMVGKGDNWQLTIVVLQLKS